MVEKKSMFKESIAAADETYRKRMIQQNLLCSNPFMYNILYLYIHMKM